MTLSPFQTLTIVAMVTLGTLITRFLPFLLFPDSKEQRPYISYLGSVLPYSVIGLLVVYCLKDVDVMDSPFGLPETAATLCIAIVHYWKANTLLSIALGTVLYMLLVQYVFCC